MFKFKSRLTATAALTLTCLAAAPAKAATPVTYVSGKGTDSGDCSSPAMPCRTFQFAVNQTSPGGEVKALDPADYRPVTINKSISITGVEGAGIDTKGGTGITVNPPPGTTINLDKLVIQNVSGSGTAGINTVGVVFGRAGGTLVDTIVSNNNQLGIDASEGTFLLGHSTVTGNGTGIGVFPPGNQATSSGDNLIYGNGTNVSDTLTKVGTQ